MAKAARRELEQDERREVLRVWTLQGHEAALDAWWETVERRGPRPTLPELQRLQEQEPEP